MKKLYRSKTNKVLSGVLGGVGEYTHTDPTILRLLFAVFVIVTGIFPGVVLYIIAIFIIPEKTADSEASHVYQHGGDSQ